MRKPIPLQEKIKMSTYPKSGASEQTKSHRLNETSSQVISESKDHKTHSHGLRRVAIEGYPRTNMLQLQAATPFILLKIDAPNAIMFRTQS